MNPILLQAFLYGGVIILTLFAVSIFLRGFFWKYYKVRTSMGRYILVKIRSLLRDHYAVGWIEEGFLCYKTKIGGKKEMIRIAIDEGTNPVYRSIAINWVDVDDEKNAIVKPDFTAVSGHDPIKFNNLLVRALMRPGLTDKTTLIIIICVIITLLVAIAGLYFSYKAYALDSKILEQLPEIIKQALAGKGTVTGSSGV